MSTSHDKVIHRTLATAPLSSLSDGFEPKQTIPTSEYILSTLNYTEEQLEWLDTHIEPFETAVIEDQHLPWLEIFFADWFKRWPEQDEEEEACSAWKQSILRRLTIQLGHGWCRQAGIETEESIQIKVKLGVLEHLHQIIEKFAISE